MSQSQPKVYVFAGEGLGIPGLPHELSEQDAERLGVRSLLKEAIKKGIYVEKRPEPRKEQA